MQICESGGMATFRDLSDVAAHLNVSDFPFDWYVMGPEGDAILFEVAPPDCETAVQHFAQHPLNLADGTPVPVLVQARRGASWVSSPIGGVVGSSTALDPDSLVGLDVEDAARQANAAGWLVRAHEREAIVTADRNPGRLNLCYGDDRVVESVHQG